MPLIAPDSGMRVDLRTIYQFNCPAFAQSNVVDILSSADSADIETGLYTLQIGPFEPGCTSNLAYYMVGFAGPFYMRKGWYQSQPSYQLQTVSTHLLHFNGSGTPNNTAGSYIRILMDSRQSGGSPYPYFSSMIQIFSAAFPYYGCGTATMRLNKIAQV